MPQGLRVIISVLRPCTPCCSCPHSRPPCSHLTLRLRGDGERYEDPEGPRERGRGAWPYQEELVCWKFPRWSRTVRGL